MIHTLSAAERSALRVGAAHVGADVDDDFERRVAVQLDLIGVWGARLRLTGERDRGTLLRKHVVDSLALAPLLPLAGVVVDIGSGAGFPGLVVAGLRPDLDVVLVESRRRKASFLGDVVRTIGLDRVRVRNARAEDVAEEIPESSALVVSRAVRLEAFLPVAARVVAPDGRVVAMQTPKQREIAAATGAVSGLGLESVREYRLLDGEPRTLFVYRR